MKWQKVTKELPEISKEVLFTDGMSVYIGERYTGNLFSTPVVRDRDGQDMDIFNVTHWIPLPELPLKR